MTVPAVVPATIPAAAPVEWEKELRGAHYLLKSGLCPTALKTPEAVLFVILAGRDLGLSPVASLRNVTVIQGKIEVSADMQLALFARAGGTFRWLTMTDTVAELVLTAPWLDAPHTSRFTMDDARRAELAGSANYKKFPKAMLRSRAITQGLKDVGFDSTAGVYAPGEIGGDHEVVAPSDAAPDAAPDASDGTVAATDDATHPGPTEKQVAFFEKMLRSSVWSDADREDWNERAAGARTVADMTAIVDAVMEEGRARKAKAVKTAAAAAASSGDESGDGDGQ